eukprot:2306127-Amphidinium_carterae.1
MLEGTITERPFRDLDFDKAGFNDQTTSWYNKLPEYASLSTSLRMGPFHVVSGVERRWARGALVAPSFRRAQDVIAELTNCNVNARTGALDIEMLQDTSPNMRARSHSIEPWGQQLSFCTSQTILRSPMKRQRPLCGSMNATNTSTLIQRHMVQVASNCAVHGDGTNTSRFWGQCAHETNL